MVSASQDEAAFEALVRQLADDEAAVASAPQKMAPASRQLLNLQPAMPLPPAPFAMPVQLPAQAQDDPNLTALVCMEVAPPKDDANTGPSVSVQDEHTSAQQAVATASGSSVSVPATPPSHTAVERATTKTASMTPLPISPIREKFKSCFRTRPAMETIIANLSSRRANKT